MQITREDVISVIQEAKSVEEAESLRSDVKLIDQGFDSLTTFNVILLLQEKYGIEISDSDIDSLNTIDEMIAYLNKRVR